MEGIINRTEQILLLFGFNGDNNDMGWGRREGGDGVTFRRCDLCFVVSVTSTFTGVFFSFLSLGSGSALAQKSLIGLFFCAGKNIQILFSSLPSQPVSRLNRRGRKETG